MPKNLSFVFAPSYPSLLRQFVYMPDTGVLCWQVCRMGINNKVGGLAAAGHVMTNGRRRITVWGIKHYAESLIWAINYKVWPSHTPEHRNGDLSDNTLENLYLSETTTTNPILGAQA